MRPNIPFLDYKQSSAFLVILSLYTETKMSLLNKRQPRIPADDFRRLQISQSTEVANTRQHYGIRQAITSHVSGLIPSFRRSAA